MRRILVIVFAITAMMAVLVTQAAVVKPTPPAIKARAYILQDFDSGKVLVEFNADESLEPASLTKMMTVYVALAQLADGKFKIGDRSDRSTDVRVQYVDSPICVNTLKICITGAGDVVKRTNVIHGQSECRDPQWSLQYVQRIIM